MWQAYRLYGTCKVIHNGGQDLASCLKREIKYCLQMATGENNPDETVERSASGRASTLVQINSFEYKCVRNLVDSISGLKVRGC